MTTYKKELCNSLSKLQKIINNNDKYEIVCDLIKQKTKLKFKNKLFYSDKDVCLYMNKLVLEEIIKYM